MAWARDDVAAARPYPLAADEAIAADDPDVLRARRRRLLFGDRGRRLAVGFGFFFGLVGFALVALDLLRGWSRDRLVHDGAAAAANEDEESGKADEGATHAGMITEGTAPGTIAEATVAA
jgi:hypothetical protein